MLGSAQYLAAVSGRRLHRERPDDLARLRRARSRGRPPAVGARLPRGTAAAPQHELPRAGHRGPHLAGHERAARLRAQLPAVPALRLRHRTGAGLARAPGRACRWRTRRRRSCWCRSYGVGDLRAGRRGGGGPRPLARRAQGRARLRRELAGERGRRCASGSPGSRWGCWRCPGSPRSTARAPARCSTASGCPSTQPLSQIAAAGGWLLIALALAGIAVPLARRPRARWVRVRARRCSRARRCWGCRCWRRWSTPPASGISGWDVVRRGRGRGRRAAHGDQGAQPPLLDAPLLPRAPQQRVRREASR